MKIRHRIAYNKDLVSKKFIEFLKEKNAKFEKTNSYIGVAYLCEEDEWKDDLYRVLQKEKVTSLIDIIYTKEEFEKAQWYSMRSKFRFEYPQPEDAFDYRNQTYDNSRYCSSCGCGLRQVEGFRINKAPKWGKRHFLMLNWIEDELFIDTIAQEYIISEKITGLEILDVINNKKNTTFEDIHQIYIENVLDPSLVNMELSVKEVLNCRSCGKVKYIYSGRGLSFKKDTFQGLDHDIVKSFETFGSGHMCARIIIVSKKFYQVLKKNKLDKDLEFEPITLI